MYPMQNTALQHADRKAAADEAAFRCRGLIAANPAAFIRQNGPSDDFGNLGHYGVAEGVGSVHPAGNPIIASNSEGCG